MRNWMQLEPSIRGSVAVSSQRTISPVRTQVAVNPASGFKRVPTGGASSPEHARHDITFPSERTRAAPFAPVACSALRVISSRVLLESVLLESNSGLDPRRETESESFLAMLGC